MPAEMPELLALLARAARRPARAGRPARTDKLTDWVDELAQLELRAREGAGDYYYYY